MNLNFLKVILSLGLVLGLFQNCGQYKSRSKVESSTIEQRESLTTGGGAESDDSVWTAFDEAEQFFQGNQAEIMSLLSQLQSQLQSNSLTGGYLLGLINEFLETNYQIQDLDNLDINQVCMKINEGLSERSVLLNTLLQVVDSEKRATIMDLVRGCLEAN